jgi:hypothetical protein
LRLKNLSVKPFPAFARRLVIQGQNRFSGGQTPEFSGIAHDRASVGMCLGPRL